MKRSDGSEPELNAELERLASAETGASKRQRSLAKYIHENCDKAAFMTIHLLAEAAKVSESTVVRFASDLGYNSFPQLRQELQEELRRRLSAQAESVEIKKTVDASSVLLKNVSDAAMSIRSAANTGNMAGIVSVEEQLTKCRNICVFGAGRAEFLALLLYNDLKQLRSGVTLVTEGELYLRADMMTDADAFICISTDSEMRSLSGLLRFIREKGSSVIAITQDGSTDCVIADTVLTAEGDAAAICILDAIVKAEEQRIGKTAADSVERQRKIRMDNLTYEQ